MWKGCRARACILVARSVLCLLFALLAVLRAFPWALVIGVGGCDFRWAEWLAGRLTPLFSEFQSWLVGVINFEYPKGSFLLWCSDHSVACRRFPSIWILLVGTTKGKFRSWVVGPFLPSLSLTGVNLTNPYANVNRLTLVIQAAYMKITASWVILPTVVNILHWVTLYSKFWNIFSTVQGLYSTVENKWALFGETLGTRSHYNLCPSLLSMLDVRTRCRTQRLIGRFTA